MENESSGIADYMVSGPMHSKIYDELHLVASDIILPNFHRIFPSNVRCRCSALDDALSGAVRRFNDTRYTRLRFSLTEWH